MGRSQETFNKKEVRNKKEKKRKEKEKKRLARKDNEKKSSLEDMMAYVDENGMISSTPPDPGRKKNFKLEDIDVSIPKKDPSQRNDHQRKGVVTYYDNSKGYGFIKDSDTHERVFVHVHNLLDEIKEGTVVSFLIMPGQRGPTATQVKIVT
ncbi:MAG: cold shock domain-containing protein [Bacteroidales bacterium]|nr:cold shock domain-containing protein [Bacteroidales bacterium]